MGRLGKPHSTSSLGRLRGILRRPAVPVDERVEWMIGFLDVHAVGTRERRTIVAFMDSLTVYPKQSTTVMGGPFLK